MSSSSTSSKSSPSSSLSSSSISSISSQSSESSISSISSSSVSSFSSESSRSSFISSPSSFSSCTWGDEDLVIEDAYRQVHNGAGTYPTNFPVARSNIISNTNIQVIDNEPISQLQPFIDSSQFYLSRGYIKLDLTNRKNTKLYLERFSRVTNNDSNLFDLVYTTTDPVSSISNMHTSPWTYFYTIEVPGSGGYAMSTFQDIVDIDLDSLVPLTELWIGVISNADRVNGLPNFSSPLANTYAHLKLLGTEACRLSSFSSQSSNSSSSSSSRSSISSISSESSSSRSAPEIPSPSGCIFRLEKIVGGKTAKMIQTAEGDTCVLQINDPTYPEQNKYKILDSFRNQWLGGMFNSEDFIIEDHLVNPAIDPSLTIGTDVHGPLGKFFATVQCEDFALSIKPLTTHGVSWKEEAGYIEEELSVTIYDPKQLSTATSGGSPLGYPDYINMDGIEWRGFALSGLPFNFLTQKPVSLQYYNFDQKILYGTSFKLKNMYNLNWEVSSKIDIDGNIVSGQILDTRSYKNIGVGSDNIWLSFQFGDDYYGSTSYTPVTGEYIDRIEPTVIPVNWDMSEARNRIPHGHPLYSYEYVERVQKISTNIGKNGIHKSNIFSIRINDSGLNETIENEQDRKTIQNIINKIIRESIVKMAPSNSQIWKIQWEGL